MYRYGTLQKNKDYYTNGTLRLEVDYTNARNLVDEKEVGIGKLYFQDGTLKYEWDITANNKIGFKKSYNRNGKLRAETYFDSQGVIINKIP